MSEHHFEPGHVGAEGWFLDPYGRHEQRWFSNGEPTALVRDGGVEGHDEPPGPLPRLPEPVPTRTTEGGGADLLRADDAEARSASAPDLLRAGREIDRPDADEEILDGPLD